MSNRFGLEWKGEDESPSGNEQQNIIPSQWPSDGDEFPLLLDQCTPTQSSIATRQSYFPSSTYSYSSTYSSKTSNITPETIQQARPKYTVKPGSMSDSRLRRKDREKKTTKKMSYKTLSSSTNKSTARNEVAPNQTTITQAYPSYSELRKQEENKTRPI